MHYSSITKLLGTTALLLLPLSARADFMVIPQPTPEYVAQTTLITIPAGSFTQLTSGTFTVNLGQQFDDASFFGGSPTATTWVAPPLIEPATPTQGWATSDATALSYTLSFSSPVRTFGLEIAPFSIGTDAITATFFNGASVVGTTSLTTTYDGNLYHAMLLAATSTDGSLPFTSVTISAPTDIGPWISRVRFSADAVTPAPEPATCGLMLSATTLVILCGWRRIRSRDC
jgi:hypothetical protein